MQDIDIWRAAMLTIKRYGEDAGPHAAQRADELMSEGATWRRYVPASAEGDQRETGRRILYSFVRP
jgi:hypothetical protein